MDGEVAWHHDDGEDVPTAKDGSELCRLYCTSQREYLPAFHMSDAITRISSVDGTMLGGDVVKQRLIFLW